jgi:branched-chain amino acid transport system ATP-binding protein
VWDIWFKSSWEDLHRMSSDIVLSARGLTKEFRGFFAVKNVDLSVERGSIHALIGPNGAGKTTCFNLLTKFIQPSAGSITFNSRDITNVDPADVARLGMVRSFQISAVFPHLTSLENVRVALQRKRGDNFDFWRSERVLKSLNEEAERLLYDIGLSAFSNVAAGTLSYGRKRALEIATTLALDPQLLLLDEPMAGMGQEDVERISKVLKTIARDRTILMVEHNLSVVASLSDRITVLARGKILAEGSYETVSKDSRVIEAYIGTHSE